MFYGCTSTRKLLGRGVSFVLSFLVIHSWILIIWLPSDCHLCTFHYLITSMNFKVNSEVLICKVQQQSADPHIVPLRIAAKLLPAVTRVHWKNMNILLAFLAKLNECLTHAWCWVRIHFMCRLSWSFKLSFSLRWSKVVL